MKQMYYWILCMDAGSQKFNSQLSHVWISYFSHPYSADMCLRFWVGQALAHCPCSFLGWWPPFFWVPSSLRRWFPDANDKRTRLLNFIVFARPMRSQLRAVNVNSIHLKLLYWHEWNSVKCYQKAVQYHITNVTILP